ncbi:MAG: hypothetical protein AB4042_16740 [Leptolyngbyaceae cyanobacterium]
MNFSFQGVRSPYSLTPNQSHLQLAKVEVAIYPSEAGQVLYRGCYWMAQFFDPRCQVIVNKGERVWVVGGDRLPLLVMPLTGVSLDGKQNG